MTERFQKIEDLVADCFREIANHSLQSEVRSIHIKSINENLKEILKILKGSRDQNTNFKTRNTMKHITESHRKSALLIAYALSRFDYHIINDVLGKRFNQTVAFEYLAQRLGLKSSTLRNYRDRFDPYVVQENSNRRGWWQIELPDELQEIKDEYDDNDYDEIKGEITDILIDN